MDNPIAAPICPSCGHPRPDRFCPQCGEERVDASDLRFRRFIGSAFTEFSNFDGTVPATLKKLVTRPGELTTEYLVGRRRAYVRPFQLYLLISLVFFVIQPHTGIFGYTYTLYAKPAMLSGLSQRWMNGAMGEAHVTEKEYAKKFNERIASQKQALLIFLVPAFALGAIPITRRRPFAVHMVFSVHFFTMLLLWFLGWIFILLFVLGPIVRILPEWMLHGPHASGDEMIILFIFVPMAIYLAKALGRVYGGGRLVNAGRAFVLMFWLNLLIVAGYRSALFFTTFYSLKLFG